MELADATDKPLIKPELELSAATVLQIDGRPITLVEVEYLPLATTERIEVLPGADA